MNNNVFINNKKFYIDFDIFCNKIIKFSILTEIENKKDIFLNIGIIYKNISIISEEENINEKELKNNKILFDEYLKLLSFYKNSNTNNFEEFIKNPDFFGNYFFAVKKEEEISEFLEIVFFKINSSDITNINFYYFNKEGREIETLLKLFSKKLKKRIRFIDTLNIISPIQYKQAENFKNRLKLIKKATTGEI